MQFLINKYKAYEQNGFEQFLVATKNSPKTRYIILQVKSTACVSNVQVKRLTTLQSGTSEWSRAQECNDL